MAIPMSLYLVAIGAFIITSAFWMVILINMGNNWYEQLETLKAQRFGLEQDLIHALEGKQTFGWILRGDGVEAVVERHRPDIRHRNTPQTSDGTTIDLTNLEDESYDF